MNVQQKNWQRTQKEPVVPSPSLHLSSIWPRSRAGRFESRQHPRAACRIRNCSRPPNRRPACRIGHPARIFSLQRRLLLKCHRQGVPSSVRMKKADRFQSAAPASGDSSLVILPTTGQCLCGDTVGSSNSRSVWLRLRFPRRLARAFSTMAIICFTQAAMKIKIGSDA